MQENLYTGSFQLPGKNHRDYNEAYGDNYVAAIYCGFSNVPKPIDGEWQHGWIIPERNIDPEFVIGSDGLSTTRKHKNYFVARKDQEKYLKEQGFTSVMAIGLPIIYTAKPKVERVKGSLLVMPVHSLSDTMETWDDEEYASFIESISNHFSEVVICLHQSCFIKGNWINAFRKKNFDIVLGADPDDSNTYDRLAFLFSRFEFVTSNDFGSQLAYAAYFGAKPSVAGPPPKFEKKDYASTTFYGNAPALLDVVDKWAKEGFYKKTFPFLYCSPQQAEQMIEWAEFQLGKSEMKNPGDLKKIFGWLFSDRIKFNSKNIVRKMLKTFIRQAASA